ncbi:MAG: hypothetical protein K0S32_3977 [Bacteroidetes bacterium]|jgi:hypothetical protein|nr:hypothetical protein [Bacteroidota bacterium]
MKTNDYLLITATAGYSFLFYQQNAGINFLIFNVLFAIVLLIRNKELLKSVNWLWALALCLVSSVSIFMNSSTLAIIANVTSLMLISALSFNFRTSFIFSFLFSMYSVLSSVVWAVIDLVTRLDKKKDESGTKQRSYKGLAISAAIFLCIIFFLLYKQANPLFAENTKWINFDFISFRWILFTIGGFYLVYGLFYHQMIPAIEKWENALPVNASDATEEQSKRYETERFGGILLFVVLNLMLIILNAGDVSTIWFNAALPKGVSHSDFVHNGVGVIIFSILIATALIMYLFRKNAPVKKNTAALKFMIYLWIFQNLVMLFSTATRNQIYIHDFNFTYKRIGVFVWICLAAIGLLLAFAKILRNKSNWYLVKNNFALWFTVLSLSSVVNWDLLITRYNISNKPLYNVDFYYLFSLSDTNIPELIEVTRHKDFPLFKDKLKNFTDHRYDVYYQQNYLGLLNDKIRHYMKDYTNDWQSYDLRDERITNAILNKQ